MNDQPTWGDLPELLGLGWHPSLPMPRYLADPGVSSGILMKQEEAPAIAKAYMDGLVDDGQTKASIEGELIHTALLEPDELEGRYVVAGSCEAILGSGKRKGQPCGAEGRAIDPNVGWVCGRHGAGDLPEPEETKVTEDQLRMALEIRDNALIEDRPLHHPAVRKILSLPGEAELTGIFKDPETDERGRIRIDRWLDQGWSIDVKTVEPGNGAMHRYARHLWNRKAHLQQGWYGHGAGVLGREPKRHVIIVAERGYPYLIQPYLLPPELVENGRRRALASLRELAECRAKGEWPGYSDELLELELLGWQRRILDEEETVESVGFPQASNDFGLF